VHTCLTELCLERNRLGDKCARIILPALLVHPSLATLDLSDNLLGDSVSQNG
jgi:Ran GTPase-activating protein (RanGAP) involved in mRNA processing and transport